MEVTDGVLMLAQNVYDRAMMESHPLMSRRAPMKAALQAVFDSVEKSIDKCPELGIPKGECHWCDNEPAKEPYTRADMLQERRDEEEARRAKEDIPTLLMVLYANGEAVESKEYAFAKELSKYLQKYMQRKE